MNANAEKQIEILNRMVAKHGTKAQAQVDGVRVFRINSVRDGVMQDAFMEEILRIT